MTHPDSHSTAAANVHAHGAVTPVNRSTIEETRSKSRSEAHANWRHTLSIWFDAILMAIGLGLIASIPPGFWGDGLVRFDALKELLTKGSLSDMQYSFIGPLFSVPLWFLGELVKSPEWWVARYNFFLFVVGLGAAWFIFKDHVDEGILRKFFLLLIGASMFPAHVPAYYGEVFTAILVGLGIMAVVLRGSRVGWAAIVLGAANTPASVPALGLVMVARALDKKRWRYLLAAVAAAGLVIAETWIRRGELISSAYTENFGFKTLMPYSGLPGFSYPFFFGVLSILLSFGKGLIWFAPGLLLPVRKVLRSTKPELWSGYVLWLTFVAGLVLVYSRWWAWSGAIFWGPRFFLFASLPASFALAVRLHRPKVGLLSNLALVAVLLLSVWVGINGVSFGEANLDICYQNNAALEHLCWYVPEFSALWHPFVQTKELVLRDLLFIAFSCVVFIRMFIPLIPTLYASFQSSWRSVRSNYLQPNQWGF